MDSSSSTRESNASTAVSDDEPRQEVERTRTPPTPGSPVVPPEPQTTDITRDIWRLHADELAWLAQREPPVFKPGDAYLPKVRNATDYGS